MLCKSSAIYLETPVDDAGAKGFYDKHGYFVFDRFEGYYNNSLDAFVHASAFDSAPPPDEIFPVALQRSQIRAVLIFAKKIDSEQNASHSEAKEVNRH